MRPGPAPRTRARSRTSGPCWRSSRQGTPCRRTARRGSAPNRRRYPVPSRRGMRAVRRRRPRCRWPRWRERSPTTPTDRGRHEVTLAVRNTTPTANGKSTSNPRFHDQHGELAERPEQHVPALVHRDVGVHEDPGLVVFTSANQPHTAIRRRAPAPGGQPGAARCDWAAARERGSPFPDVIGNRSRKVSSLVDGSDG